MPTHLDPVPPALCETLVCDSGEILEAYYLALAEVETSDRPAGEEVARLLGRRAAVRKLLEGR